MSKENKKDNFCSHCCCDELKEKYDKLERSVLDLSHPNIKMRYKDGFIEAYEDCIEVAENYAYYDDDPASYSRCIVRKFRKRLDRFRKEN